MGSPFCLRYWFLSRCRSRRALMGFWTLPTKARHPHVCEGQWTSRRERCDPPRAPRDENSTAAKRSQRERGRARDAVFSLSTHKTDENTLWRHPLFPCSTCADARFHSKMPHVIKRRLQRSCRLRRFVNDSWLEWSQDGLPSWSLCHVLECVCVHVCLPLLFKRSAHVLALKKKKEKKKHTKS